MNSASSTGAIRKCSSCAALGIALLAACSVSGEKSLELRVDEASTVIGDYRAEDDPTLRGAPAVFGEPSECRILPVTKFSLVRWRQLGLRMEFGSYGGYPRGGNACVSRAHARLSRVYVTGPRWRTSRGLRVGDTQDRLAELYPKANRVRGGGHRLGGSGSGTVARLVARRPRDTLRRVPSLSGPACEGRARARLRVRGPRWRAGRLTAARSSTPAFRARAG